MSVVADDTYLESLNEAQRRAVVFDFKKALQIIAGPGTGKTKVLTARFAYLVLKKKMNPEDIIMTTFTRKAAEEMKERLVPVLSAHGISAHGLKIGTFHSICWKLLKEKGFLIGKDRIQRAGTEKIKSIMEEIMVEMPDQIRDYACTKSYKNEVSLCRIQNNQWQVHPDMVLKRISELKADAVTPEKYEQQKIYDEALLHFYQQYQAKLTKEDLIDFDDVMLYSFELLSKHRVWKNIRHVLVDEFQDTNLLQIHLIFQFARGSHHSCEGVTVVGDPDQGIYGFRSALSHNFHTMIELCPIEYDQIVLKENYRSAQSILDISETVIKQQKNGRGNREPLRAQFVTDNKPVYMSFPSDEIEAYTIAKEIIYLKSIPGLFQYQDFAILVRLKRSLRAFENSLIAHKIPYVIQKGYTFWELKECKAIVRYMSMICGDDDWDSLKRTINYPVRGIGETTVGKIAAIIEKQKQLDSTNTAFQVLRKIASGQIPSSLSNSSIIGIKEYLDTIEELRKFYSEIYSDAGKDVIADAFEKLYILTGLKDLYKPEKKTDSSVSNSEPAKDVHRHLNILNVKNYFSTFKISHQDDEVGRIMNLVDFCREFVSFTDLYTFKEENDNERKEKEDHNNRDAVVLSTIHASKGLEWPVVFVPQCVEGRLPSYYKDSSDMPAPNEDSDEESEIPNAGKEPTDSQDENTESKINGSPTKKKSKTSFSEERRMFFVALTRAKYLLFITAVEKEATIFKSRFLKNEVLELCDDTLKCFESTEQLFKLYYTLKIQIPNQDKISYNQLIKDYYRYSFGNRQLIFWKDQKYSHVDLPNTSENVLGLDLKRNDNQPLGSSALPRVNRTNNGKNTVHVRPGELIVKQEQSNNHSIPLLHRREVELEPNISPTKAPRLTKKETAELEFLLSDEEFLPDTSIKKESQYTAAEILHNAEETVIDNRPILTNARVLASAIKEEASQSIPIKSTSLCVKQEEASTQNSQKNLKRSRKEAKKKRKLTEQNQNGSQSSGTDLPGTDVPDSKLKDKKSSKRMPKKVKQEPSSTNDILRRLEKAKLRREEWDGEIIDLRSSQ